MGIDDNGYVEGKCKKCSDNVMDGMFCLVV